MAETPTADSKSGISEEGLRKAEAISSRKRASPTACPAGRVRRDRDRGRDVAVPPLRRLRDRPDPGAALHACRLRAGAVLSAVSGGACDSATTSAGGMSMLGLTCVGILVYAIVGGEDFTDRATMPNRHRRHSRRHLHRAADRGVAPHHRLDRAGHRAPVHRLCAGRAVSAAALEPSRLRLRRPGRSSVHYAGRNFRHSGRRVGDADRAVLHLRRRSCSIPAPANSSSISR